MNQKMWKTFYASDLLSHQLEANTVLASLTFCIPSGWLWTVNIVLIFGIEQWTKSNFFGEFSKCKTNRDLTFSHIAGEKQNAECRIREQLALDQQSFFKNIFLVSHSCSMTRRSSEFFCYLQRDTLKGRNELKRTAGRLNRLKRRRVSEKEGMWRNQAWSFVSDWALPKMSQDSGHTTSSRNSVAWNAN